MVTTTSTNAKTTTQQQQQQQQPSKMMSNNNNKKQKLIEGKYTESHLMQVVKKTIQRKTEQCKLLDIEAENKIPKLDDNGTTKIIFNSFFAK